MMARNRAAEQKQQQQQQQHSSAQLCNEWQARLMEATSEHSTAALLTTILNTAITTKEGKMAVISAFTEPASSIPDLLFGLGRRFLSCVPQVTAIIQSASDSSDFVRKVFRNRTNAAFLKFLPLHEPIAKLFAHLICGHVHAAKAFAVSEGEMVMADVLAHFGHAAKPSTVVYLTKIVARLVSESAPNLQNRHNLLGSFLVLVGATEPLAILSTALRNRETTFFDTLLSILRAAAAIDAMIAPVDLSCFLLRALISEPEITNDNSPDGSYIANSSFSSEVPRMGDLDVDADECARRRPVDWDPLACSLAQFLLNVPSSEERLASSLLRTLFSELPDTFSTFSTSLRTSLLQCARSWVNQGWHHAGAVLCAGIALERTEVQNTTLQIATVSVLLAACGSRSPEILESLMMACTVARAAPVYTSAITFGGKKHEITADERLLSELWVCFVHVATHLRTAGVRPLFRPLARHIEEGVIKEQRFRELTKWPRNDQADERRFLQCQRESEECAALEAAEFSDREQIASNSAFFQKMSEDFETRLKVLQADPGFQQRHREWTLASKDAAIVAKHRENAIAEMHSKMEQGLQTTRAEMKENFDRLISDEKRSHKRDIDGIVWDADELATKDLHHHNRLAALEKQYEKDRADTENLFAWRLQLCDEVSRSMERLEKRRAKGPLVLERQEELHRGRCTISTTDWLKDGFSEMPGVFPGGIEAEEARAFEIIANSPEATKLKRFHYCKQHERRLLNEFRLIGVCEMETSLREIILREYEAWSLRPTLHEEADSLSLDISERSHSMASSQTSLTTTGASSSSPTAATSSTHSRPNTSPAPVSSSSSPSSSPLGPTKRASTLSTQTVSSPLSSNQTTGQAKRSPIRRSDTSEMLALHEQLNSNRKNVIALEMQWRRYFTESLAVSVLRALAKEEFFAFCRINIASREDSRRIIVFREWQASLPRLPPPPQPPAPTRSERPGSPIGGGKSISNLGMTLHQPGKSGVETVSHRLAGPRVVPTVSLSTNHLNTSYLNTSHLSATEPAAESASITSFGAKESIDTTFHFQNGIPSAKAVHGTIRKNTLPKRNDIQELEAQRRGRIVTQYRLVVDMLRAYAKRLVGFEGPLQQLVQEEEEARKAELEAKHVFWIHYMVNAKLSDERTVVASFHMMELERQRRGFLVVDETIALNQILVHRPRGRRYRPPRDDDTPDNARHIVEPAISHRVKAWLRQMVNEAPVACFAEASPLEPIPTVNFMSIASMDATWPLPQGPMHVTNPPPFLNPQAKTRSICVSVTASAAPQRDELAQSDSTVTSMESGSTLGRRNLSLQVIGQRSIAASGVNFVSRFRDGVQFERTHILFVGAIERLEAARRLAMCRAEATVRASLAFPFAKGLSVRAAEDAHAFLKGKKQYVSSPVSRSR